MNLKLKHFFIIFSILLLAIQVQADAPISYNKELASDVELRGTFFTNDNADGFYVSLIGENSIQIVSDIHYIDKTIKMKKTALDSRFKKFNEINIGITHISDDGIVNNYISPVVVDGEFVLITVDFSTIIINGMTGTTTTTLTGLSGNQSISVPDGLSYDLNITNNQPSVWIINGTDFPKRVLWTLNTTSENLTDFQVGRITPYDSDMQVDMDDRLLTYYENDTLISFWDENVTNSVNATGYVKVPKTSTTEQQQFWLYYGNSSVSSASSGNDTFVLYDGVRSTSYVSDLDITSFGYVYEAKVSRPTLTQADSPNIGFGDDATSLPSDGVFIMLYDNYGGNYYRSVSYIGGVLQSNPGSATPIYFAGVPFKLKVEYISSSLVRFYSMDTQLGSDLTSNIPTDLMGLHSYVGDGLDVNWQFIRKYTATEPTWVADGEEQTASGTLNITTSVTGDNNTQSYNTSQSREFTLTPTGTTNNVIINTTSTDYNVTVTTYWTENTTLQSETATAGYAKQYINYTPSFNITSADLNTTFTFNFSAQDYIGTASSTLNDVSKTTTRDGQYVNASVGSLTESTYYWWNVTVPYNNIFTLSEQSNTTAFLGVSKQFNDSTYNDPEGLPIDSRLWNFGDGDNSSSSNPNHTYLTVGDLNANYSVTETATVSPQTLVREFNVSVSVQPVQNLTSLTGIDYIQFDWDNYSSADYWNVSQLNITIPYTPSYPVLDGIEDACYECCCAYGFVGDSPNPYTDYGKELIYILRNDTYLILYADGEDNDGLPQDDEFVIGIDASNNNLTSDDRKFILGEGGTVTAEQWSEITESWTYIATNAQGVVVGAGTPGAVQYEMFIPVSELDTNFTNGSTVKFMMSRVHTGSTPNVESYYPHTLQNDTDATLWQSVLLSETPQYTYINNTSISEYNVTGLDPYTWYQHQFTAINGSHESSSVDYADITQQILLYSVSGYILDISGNPIAGAFVYAENGFVEEGDTSDVYGFYEGIRFKTQNYTITANKSGYVDNFITVNVTGNLTNQNITLTAFEMTDWMLWEKLLEIEDAIDDLSTDFTPTEGNYEMLSSTYNIFLLLLGACFILAFPKRGEVTERDTGLNNVLFSFLGTILSIFLAQIIVSGQVVESFAFESQIYDPLQHYFLYLIAVIMFVVFALNVVYYIRQRID